MGSSGTGASEGAASLGNCHGGVTEDDGHCRAGASTDRNQPKLRNRSSSVTGTNRFLSEQDY